MIRRSIRQNSKSGYMGTEGPEFIQCVDFWEPQMHEIWCFGSHCINREVHSSARVYVGAVLWDSYRPIKFLKMGVESQFPETFPSLEVSNFWVSLIYSKSVDPCK